MVGKNTKCCTDKPAKKLQIHDVQVLGLPKTQEGSVQESNPEPPCCKATVQSAAPAKPQAMMEKNCRRRRG